MRIDQFRAAATNVAVPHQEWPSVVRRRRVIVCVVLVAGATLMAYSLNQRPGAASFYWLTLSL
ncbi:MAG: CPBP family intramembrane metalloprotease, partial [Actinobacteria bacterium]|nr:CPBP family intramembrane metalloprotease [Actinomycetota bacterium]